MYYKVDKETLDPASKVSHSLSVALGLIAQAIEKLKQTDNAAALDIVYESIFPCIRSMKKDVMVVSRINAEIRKHYYNLFEDTYRIFISISFSAPAEAIIDTLKNVSTIYSTLRKGWDEILLNKTSSDTNTQSDSENSIKHDIKA